MPNKELRKYIALFGPVILVLEHGTSKMCLWEELAAQAPILCRK
jgi:hypothetical protein